MAYGGTSGHLTTLQLKRAPSYGEPSSAKKRGSRPCKYGDRTSAGKCPKKPNSARPPCKFGPRTASGRCPKKPRSLSGAMRTDLKAGRSPFESGSTTRAAGKVAAEATAQRLVVRASRGLENSVKKLVRNGAPAALAAIRTSIIPAAVLMAGVYAGNAAFLKARTKALAKVVEGYKARIAITPKPIPPKVQLQLAEWLRVNLERVAAQYDQRGIEERQGY